MMIATSSCQSTLSYPAYPFPTLKIKHRHAIIESIGERRSISIDRFDWFSWVDVQLWLTVFITTWHDELEGGERGKHEAEQSRKKKGRASGRRIARTTSLSSGRDNQLEQPPANDCRLRVVQRLE